MRFSEKIIKLRKENGLSQEEFGNMINVSRQAISKWESEQSQPDIGNVKEISKVFNVNIEYLINDDLEEEFKEEKNKKRNNKKYLKNILIIIFLIFIIYLCLSMVKAIRLVQLYNKVKKIDENERYEISNEVHREDKLTGEKWDFEDVITFCNNVCLKNHYEDGNYDRPQTINYINWNNNNAYSLTYNEKIEKYEYVLENVEENNSKEMNIKATTLNLIPTTFKEIILYAINPNIRVYLTEDIIKTRFKDGYNYMNFDKDTGEIEEIYTVSDTFYFYERYNYEWNDELISDDSVEEPINDEDIKYVKIDFDE